MHYRNLAVALLALVCGPFNAWPQEPGTKATGPESSSSSGPVQQLQLQVQQLQAMVQELKDETVQYRTETLQLRHELQSMRERLEAGKPPAETLAGAAPAGGASEKSGEQRVAKLEEDVQLLGGKVDDQYQTKVENGAKYRVRLSGLLLMNIFSNTGNVDHVEVPGVALATTPSLTSGNTGGSFGATIRQSQLGIEVYGPTLAGARTRGDIVADFFGEFPETTSGSSSGSLRLRTGTVRLEWQRTSVIAGLDNLFFSPAYPTSFASLSIPALSYAGNLWGWLPQLRVEHKLIASENSTLTIAGGILDPLTGETPPNEFLRIPGAGESSRQPGYGTRVEWGHRIWGQMLTVGSGGFYSRENWGFNRNVDGWAATADWNVPFGNQFSLNGKFYRGRAIGGLGAGIGRSILSNGPLSDPATIVRGLRSTGGWAQVKYRPAAKLEFNAAAGQNNDNTGDIRGFPVVPGTYFPADLARNRSEFINFIYRPRSNLLFSTEFRTLRTFSADGSAQRAKQLNLIMGVYF
ncbi:MAG TPA: hypothetical protein VNW97_02035 [Candidatus Saccharimonadales bacterium]|jgi:hypothetical protein|nr:hypothetical protein [Candidatus Saccharimonadales bacterium]